MSVILLLRPPLAHTHRKSAMFSSCLPRLLPSNAPCLVLFSLQDREVLAERLKAKQEYSQDLVRIPFCVIVCVFQNHL